MAGIWLPARKVSSWLAAGLGWISIFVKFLENPALSALGRYFAAWCPFYKGLGTPHCLF